MIAIGETAPDFKLKDQNGKVIQLSGLSGKKVLLSFKPLAWTSVCQDQMKLLEENVTLLNSLNTVAFGMGVDSVPCNKAWAKSMDVKITGLLSDFWPHGEVARLYGVFREKDGFSDRANIIIDENQKVVFARIYPTSQLPDFTEIFEFLQS